MSARDKGRQWILFGTLLLFGLSLGLHFAGEGMTSASVNPGHDLSGSGDQTVSTVDPCEDQFILPRVMPVPQVSFLMVRILTFTGTSLFTTVPLLPPPNA